MQGILLTNKVTGLMLSNADVVGNSIPGFTGGLAGATAAAAGSSSSNLSADVGGFPVYTR